MPSDARVDGQPRHLQQVHGDRAGVRAQVFLHLAIASSDGEEAHSQKRCATYRQLIDAEPASAVLSDDKIVEQLKRDGIDIARRTVAKYREHCASPPPCNAGARSRWRCASAPALRAATPIHLQRAGEPLCDCSVHVAPQANGGLSAPTTTAGKSGLHTV